MDQGQAGSVDQIAEAEDDDGANASQKKPDRQPALAATSLAALGIVFGDIGTSPLYTLKTVLSDAGQADRGVMLGALSLLVWTLIIIATLKYVALAMRADNDGEGGILALMSLISKKIGHKPFIVAARRLGAARR